MEFLGLTLTQWVTGATVLGVLIALITLALQIKGQRSEVKENKKTRSAQVSYEFGKRLLENDDFRQCSRMIDDAIKNKTKIIINENPTVEKSNSINKIQLDNYLSELETLGLFINDGVISVKYGYELFGDQIDNVFTNDEIKTHVVPTKAKTDLWDNLITVHDKLLKYETEKIS
jgi:hypothetical protein